jgi:hypothetical protein
MFTEADSTVTGDHTAVYIRRRTDRQEERHKRNDVESRHRRALFG